MMQTLGFWVCILSPAMVVDAQTLPIKEGNVVFEIRNAGLSVEGSMYEVQGVVEIHEGVPLRIQAKVPISTLRTGIKMRDEHLAKEEYFHADKYPYIEVECYDIHARAQGWEGACVFRIKGKTLSKTLTFQMNTGTFTSTFELNRLEAGVGSKSWVLSNDVKVTLTTETKQ